jgi:hypothetical protein
MLTGGVKRELKIKGISIAILAVFIFLLMVAANYPQFIERYYSEGLYPVICHMLHPVFNLFPFSIGDVLYVFAIIYLGYALIRLIKLSFKKQFYQAGLHILKLTIGLQCSILVFYLFWGMNYFRPSAGQLLNLRDSVYTTAQLKSVTAVLIDSANCTRERLTPADLKQSNKLIYQTAIAAVKTLSRKADKFETYNPEIKPSVLTPLLNYISTSGYYNPFTSEAQMNYQMPIFERPVTACHELAHQMGYGAEDEANFVGFLAGSNSRDKLQRYSAYHLAVDEFMHALYFRDSLANKALKPRVSVAVHNDFKAERKYWLSYQNKAEIITGIFYDKFLKVNNQPQGIKTYNRMVQLVMALYLKRTIVSGS